MLCFVWFPLTSITVLLFLWHTNEVIGPTCPYSSVEHGKFAYVGYTGAFNVLDYPGVSFPCGVTADKGLDGSYVDHKPLSDIDAQIQSDCMFPLYLSVLGVC